jgi:hypothetical protein
MLIVTRLMNDHIDDDNAPQPRNYNTFTFLCPFSALMSWATIILRNLSDGVFGVEDRYTSIHR